MGQVFISYSHHDSDFVNALVADLRARDAAVWCDTNIQPGEDWIDAIQDALDESTILLLVLTPASMKSDEVKKEWRYFESDKKPILLALLEDTRVSYRLHGLQYIDFRDRPPGSRAYRESLLRLTGALRAFGVACLDQPPAPAAETAAAEVAVPSLAPTAPLLPAAPALRAARPDSDQAIRPGAAMPVLPRLEMEPGVQKAIWMTWQTLQESQRAWMLTMVAALILSGIWWGYSQLGDEKGLSTSSGPSGQATMTLAANPGHTATWAALSTEAAHATQTATAQTVTPEPTLTATPTPTPTGSATP